MVFFFKKVLVWGGVGFIVLFDVLECLYAFLYMFFVFRFCWVGIFRGIEIWFLVVSVSSFWILEGFFEWLEGLVGGRFFCWLEF